MPDRLRDWLPLSTCICMSAGPFLSDRLHVRYFLSLSASYSYISLVYLFVFVSVSLGASTFVSLSSSLPGIAVSLRAHVYLSGPLCTSLYSCALTFHKLLITSCATFAGRRTDAPQKLIPDPARNFRTRTSGPMTDK